MGFECLDAQGRRKGIGTTGPAGATGAPGSLTLLESYTASASATIDFKTRNASGPQLT